MDVVRPSDNSSPGSIPIGMGDQPSGVALFASIMTALYRREKTGKGGEVYTSLMANGLGPTVVISKRVYLMQIFLIVR